jgi:shikimate dehydrogenase
LGSGATARSALASFPSAIKLIHARNQVASQSLSEQFGAEIVSARTAFEADVLISTLPKGVLVELAASQPKPNILLDAVYTNPEVQSGRYVSGLEMLIHQAIFQQRIFAFGDEEKPIKNEPELLEGLRKLLSVAK